MTGILHDTLRTSQLEDLRQGLISRIETMELQKKALDSCFAQDMEDIRLQREQLDKERGESQEERCEQ